MRRRATKATTKHTKHDVQSNRRSFMLVASASVVLRATDCCFRELQYTGNRIAPVSVAIKMPEVDLAVSGHEPKSASVYTWREGVWSKATDAVMQRLA